MGEYYPLFLSKSPSVSTIWSLTDNERGNIAKRLEETCLRGSVHLSIFANGNKNYWERRQGCAGTLLDWRDQFEQSKRDATLELKGVDFWKVPPHLTLDWLIQNAKHPGDSIRVNPQEASNEDAFHREVLQAFLNDYKTKYNDGFGLVKITNSFTAPELFKGNSDDSDRRFRKKTRLDFAPKFGNAGNNILYELLFPLSGRVALHQGVDQLESGEHVENVLHQFVIISMDGGHDMAILKVRIHLNPSNPMNSS